MSFTATPLFQPCPTCQPLTALSQPASPISVRRIAASRVKCPVRNACNARNTVKVNSLGTFFTSSGLPDAFTSLVCPALLQKSGLFYAHTSPSSLAHSHLSTPQAVLATTYMHLPALPPPASPLPSPFTIPLPRSELPDAYTYTLPCPTHCDNFAITCQPHEPEAQCCIRGEEVLLG